MKKRWMLLLIAGMLCLTGCQSEEERKQAEMMEAFEQIVRCMKECGVGYGSINHPVDRDPVCGYNGIIGDVCPRCGRRDGEGVPLEKLQKLGLYKHLNASTLGQCGNPDEEADRIPNPLV